ncbi:MAG: carboxypeptidase-like regulatory domain-containing protein, partial [Bacteroidetes bacterium]|nr:carboxypeptidase-like regulatory domain-containing protein [Bacteroidota bacterium]
MAQGTGTLAGRVTDAADGQGLPGANVVIEGTSLGAATDLDGNYRIIGVPTAQYDVTARFIGYEQTTELGVEINSGYTRRIDFELQDASVELGGIEIVYERPLIQADAIGAPRYISGDEIQNLPVRGVANVAAIQSGVVSDDNSDNLFIRGGREQEVQYYVDGVKVSGPLAVNQNAIQEQEMLIGSIPARYGDVQSGVISITTRTGRDRFFGSAELITSEGLDSYGYNLGSLSLGGPIVPGMVGFFVSAQGTLLSDRNPYGVDTYRLTDAAYADLIASPQVLRLFNIDNPEETQYIDFPWQAVQAAINDGGIVDAGVMENILNSAGAIPAGWSLDGFSPVDAPRTYTEVTPGLSLARGK